MRITHGIRRLEFDGTAIRLSKMGGLGHSTVIPLRNVASIDVPGHLSPQVMKIVTTGGTVHEFPAYFQQSKLEAFRDEVMAAQASIAVSG